MQGAGYATLTRASFSPRWGEGFGERGGKGQNVRCLVALGSLGQLDLHPVDAVDTVDEENQDEDEGDFEAIL